LFRPSLRADDVGDDLTVVLPVVDGLAVLAVVEDLAVLAVVEGLAVLAVVEGLAVLEELVDAPGIGIHWE
jgi:hypothetical protein